MKRRRLAFPTIPDPVKQGRVDELLHLCAVFEQLQRQVPGHVRRELVMLAPHWGKRSIPRVIVEAREILTRSAR